MVINPDPYGGVVAGEVHGQSVCEPLAAAAAAGKSGDGDGAEPAAGGATVGANDGRPAAQPPADRPIAHSLFYRSPFQSRKGMFLSLTVMCRLGVYRSVDVASPPSLH
jgi:hypothetical protein